MVDRRSSSGAVKTIALPVSSVPKTHGDETWTNKIQDNGMNRKQMEAAAQDRQG